MKDLLICIVFLMLAFSLPASAQSPQLAFNQAANMFIEGQNQQALQQVNSALQRYPNDPKLLSLKEKLEQQQEQQQQQQQNQQDQQEQGDQQEQQEQESSGEQKEQQEESSADEPKEGEEQAEEKEGKEGEGEKQEQEAKEGEQEGQEQEEPMPGQSETERRLEEMDISPEKARMILEAMKSNEIQYLQQQKRRQQKRTDRDKPDW